MVIAVRFNSATVRASARVSGIQECFMQGTRNNVWDAGMATGRAMKTNMARMAPAHPAQNRRGRWVQAKQLSDITSYSGPSGNVAYLRMSVSVGCTAGHAIYVHEGTLGLAIAPDRASNLFIPPGPWGPRRSPKVAGQKANPWMTRAMAQTLALRGYVR